MKRNFETVNRIVIKIGTSSLVMPNGKINLEKLDQLAFVISSLMNKGKDVILVSSGAMGFGLNVLNMDKRPTEIARQQAVSSVGQVAMMSLYSQIFAHYQTKVSQLLITRDVVEYPESLANFTNAFETLLSMGIVPIVNENDVVADEELKGRSFGDNDWLSFLIAKLVRADTLILLTTVDGLLDADGKRISRVSNLRNIGRLVRPGEKGRLSKGGMDSKLKAVRAAVAAGIDVYIANGRKSVLVQIMEGKALGTFFPANAL